MFVHNKPSVFNDTTESTRVKYSFDINNLASVFLLTRSHMRPIVPPGQPDYRSTKGPVSHHVARPQSTDKPRTAPEPRPLTQDNRHDPRQPVCADKARRTYSRLHLFTTRLNCREPIGSRPCSVHCPDYITTRSTPSDSLNAADVYAPWCHLVFRHASVMTAVVIGCYLKSGESRFSWGIC